jgi:3-oxoacyl-[acyl-carrier protein] reductase
MKTPVPPTRTALVTGASRGIGHGLALDLAQQGYGLTISSRSAEDLEPTADELRRAGAPQVVVHACDLADREALPALVTAHHEAFGSMDALMLSGGVGTAGVFEQLSPQRIDKTLAVNLTSTIALVQQALPLLRTAAADSQNGARVVILSSITGVYAEAGLAVYGASKAALVSLAVSLNAEESGNGVMFTAVAPAYVATDMSAWITEQIPSDSMIPVADIVALVRTLLALGQHTSITNIVVSRSGASPYSA